MDAIIGPAKARMRKLTERFFDDLYNIALDMCADVVTASLASGASGRRLAVSHHSMCDELTRPVHELSRSRERSIAGAPRQVRPRAIPTGALAESIARLLSDKPGQTLEQINRALGTTRKQLLRTVRRLIATQLIYTEGVTRATRYFLAGTRSTEVLPSGLSS